VVQYISCFIPSIITSDSSIRVTSVFWVMVLLTCTWPMKDYGHHLHRCDSGFCPWFQFTWFLFRLLCLATCHSSTQEHTGISITTCSSVSALNFLWHPRQIINTFIWFCCMDNQLDKKRQGTKDTHLSEHQRAHIGELVIVAALFGLQLCKCGQWGKRNANVLVQNCSLVLLLHLVLILFHKCDLYLFFYCKELYPW